MDSHRQNEKHWLQVAGHCLIDFSLFLFAFLLAMRLRFGMEWLNAPLLMWPGIVFGGSFFACAVYIAGFYAVTPVPGTRFRQAVLLMFCQGASIMVMMAIFYVNFSTRIGRGIMVMAIPLAYLLSLLHHFSFGFHRHRAPERVALIVTSEEDELDAGLINSLGLHYLELVGLIRHGDFQPGRKQFQVLGDTSDLLRLCRDYRLTRVLCTNAGIEERGLYQHFCQLRYAGTHVMTLLSLCEEYYQCVPVDLVTPEWLMAASGAPHMLYVQKIKRGFDILLSLIGGVFFTPALLLGMALVKLSSRGPVFFRQTRCGRFGRLFKVIKLRTMCEDAEAAGAVWAQEKDPRITRVGRFLRKYRLDEIPQLWNVLKGEMSFVGPRPERPEFVEKLEQDIPFYRERLLIQPGITGWAQVSYPYGANKEDARRKLEYDLYYMKHMSILLDIFILLDTVRIILVGGIGATHKARQVDYPRALATTRNQADEADAVEEKP